MHQDPIRALLLYGIQRRQHRVCALTASGDSTNNLFIDGERGKVIISCTDGHFNGADLAYFHKLIQGVL